MRGCSKLEKSGAGGGAGSGSAIVGHEISSGIRSSSCGVSRDAVCVPSARASADAKSRAVGVVLRAPTIDVLASARKCSMYSSTCDLNISSAEGFTLSNPAITSAALMLLSSWPCAKTGSCGAGSMFFGRFWTCRSAWCTLCLFAGMCSCSAEEECGRFVPACADGEWLGAMLKPRPLATASMSSIGTPAASPLLYRSEMASQSMAVDSMRA